MTVYLGDKAVGVNTIVEKEVAKTKFGASVDTWIGDVDENGTLNQSTWTGALNFVGVKTVGKDGLQYAFYNRTKITSVNLSSLQSVDERGLYNTFFYCAGITGALDLSSLQSVGSSSLYNTFNGCTGITSVNLSSLQSVVGGYGLYSTFYGCKGITSADLSSLQSVVGGYGLSRIFYGCTGITSVNLSSLQSVGDSGLYSAFDGCAQLAALSFPSLTVVSANCFGSASYSYAFRGCTALAEIHFRADMQATIEAMTGYADKWGATSSTIYFDL